MHLVVNIDVNDLELAVQFYASAFHLRVGRRFGTDGVELLGASSPIYLLAKAGGTRACCGSDQSRNYERHWTPVHLDIVVDDINSAVDQATRAGAVLEQDIKSSSWGKLAIMADPFGHGFCLIEFVGKGYDEIASNG